MLYLFKHLLLIKTLKQGQGDGISEMLKQPFDYAQGDKNQHDVGFC